MSSATPNGVNFSHETIDALIAQYSKGLKPGETISIPLYKGETSKTTIDPLQATKANKAAAAIGAKEPSKAVISRNELTFPRMMKFIETVEKPNFDKQFKDGRLYVEDIPKAKVSKKAAAITLDVFQKRELTQEGGRPNIPG